MENSGTRAAAGTPDTSAVTDEDLWKASQGMCFAAVWEDTQLAGAPLDSFTVMLPGGAGQATRILGSQDRWAVDSLWLFWNERPGVLFSPAQMESLETAEITNDRTMVGMVQYRVTVEAKDNLELLREARAHTPRYAPLRLTEEVRKTLRELHESRT
jgi:hypothetical protein